eukprot:766498-Hanusia_phi.AAC.9
MEVKVVASQILLPNVLKTVLIERGAESAMTVLMGDGIVVDESGTYWYSYRLIGDGYLSRRQSVKGRKVSARGVWSDPRVALDLSAMKTVKIESQPGLLICAWTDGVPRDGFLPCQL